MTTLQTVPLAVLIGLLFNANPSCGSGTLLWVSTQPAPSKMAALALTRIAVLAAVGAVAGLFGAALRRPWGLLLIVVGIHLPYTTLHQSRMPDGACEMPRNSSALPGLLALVPPPSGYIGLAVFYGGFQAPSAAEGAWTLAFIGVGLTLPVWLAIWRPAWAAKWRRHQASSPRWHRWQLAFKFMGATLLIVVGLAFVFVKEFHRPLLELVR